MFGFLHGTNRRLEPILRAWSSFSAPERLRLTLFGEYDRTLVEGLIHRFGLREWVDLRGFCDDASMAKALAEADLAINLRYPSRGEASGSLLRIWSHGLPCLVSRTGYYAELADRLVTKIDPANEEAELHLHWERFLQQPEAYRAQGLAGRQHLEAHHTPIAYVERLMAFLPEVAHYRAQAHLERWLPRVAQKFIAPIPQWEAQRHWQERIAAEVATWTPNP